MKFRKSGNVYVLRVDKGEEVINQITKVCSENGIKAAYFTAIGAAGRVKIGWFDTVNKVYNTKDINENMEITSIIGNIGTLEDGNLVIHSHINLSDKDYKLIGGHLFECEVSLVCEIFITDLGEKIVKSDDNEFGLNFIKL